MTTHEERSERLRMPGEEPTDADLRTDVELTRRELAGTVAALSAKADVRTRMREAARQRAEAVRAGGAELVDRLPDPVARRVRPVWAAAADHPAVPLGGLAVLAAGLTVWLRVRGR